ncbi:hypothetical protein PAXRUDRAFT_835702 [Paxillus rubicundulus Ve08.2h10]|uniref:Uncharacterized protein n=1 Tax=Paxillus rubicundulus Ve08.2h10 TaxID=930991 RepID=A0A0D0D5L4_9AGAM|nr:hypothetical protein PAXRUDRAFT_835702 [Paxillus rubicundulus Ve08.2h10]
MGHAPVEEEFTANHQALGLARVRGTEMNFPDRECPVSTDSRTCRWTEHMSIDIKSVQPSCCRR